MSEPKFHRNLKNQVRPCKAENCRFSPVANDHPDVIEFLAQKNSHSNVSHFEKQFCSNFEKWVNTGIYDFGLLETPVNNRPVAFRTFTTDEEMLSSFQNLKYAIEEKLNITTVVLTSSTNNRIGSDFFETTTKTHIELKLGAATAANLGVEKVATIIPATSLAKLPSNADRELWRTLYRANPEEASTFIVNRHNQMLKNVAEEINRNKTLAEGANVTLNNLYQGYNVSSENAHKLATFYLQPDFSWKEQSRPYVENASWGFSQALFSTKTGRLNLFAVNPVLNATWKATYNYKNNYPLTLSNGEKTKAPAKLGLGSPSFNCWFNLEEKNDNRATVEEMV